MEASRRHEIDQLPFEERRLARFARSATGS